ncbi:MAG: hypothetical protein K0U36_05590, partial [Alphaproteobacteria bacterium]|nr:hypothetical protein [Alphaproteobacteria bacterium]
MTTPAVYSHDSERITDGAALDASAIDIGLADNLAEVLAEGATPDDETADVFALDDIDFDAMHANTTAPEVVATTRAADAKTSKAQAKSTGKAPSPNSPGVPPAALGSTSTASPQPSTTITSDATSAMWDSATSPEAPSAMWDNATKKDTFAPPRDGAAHSLRGRAKQPVRTENTRAIPQNHATNATINDPSEVQQLPVHTTTKTFVRLCSAIGVLTVGALGAWLFVSGDLLAPWRDALSVAAFESMLLTIRLAVALVIILIGLGLLRLGQTFLYEVDVRRSIIDPQQRTRSRLATISVTENELRRASDHLEQSVDGSTEKINAATRKALAVIDEQNKEMTNLLAMQSAVETKLRGVLSGHLVASQQTVEQAQQGIRASQESVENQLNTTAQTMQTIASRLGALEKMWMQNWQSHADRLSEKQSILQGRMENHMNGSVQTVDKLLNRVESRYSRLEGLLGGASTLFESEIDKRQERIRDTLSHSQDQITEVLDVMQKQISTQLDVSQNQLLRAVDDSRTQFDAVVNQHQAYLEDVLKSDEQRVRTTLQTYADNVATLNEEALTTVQTIDTVVESCAERLRELPAAADSLIERASQQMHEQIGQIQLIESERR